MASSPFQHLGRRMIPLRGQSWTVGWWLQVSEIRRWCRGYLRMQRSTVDRDVTYKVKRWGDTSTQCFQSYWLKDTALCESWVLDLFPWSGEFCSTARRMTWGMYIVHVCMTGQVCLPQWSHVDSLPPSHGNKVNPSGRLPSVRANTVGSLQTGMHVWATQMLQPKHIETATLLTASSEGLNPHTTIGSALIDYWKGRQNTRSMPKRLLA